MIVQLEIVAFSFLEVLEIFASVNREKTLLTPRGGSDSVGLTKRGGWRQRHWSKRTVLAAK